MKYEGTLVVVQDIIKSRLFYEKVLGLEVTADFGANVTLDGGVVLQSADTWKNFIGNRPVTMQSNSIELYFEERNMDKFIERLKGQEIEYVHELIEHPWGQRVVRFYDPDKHIVEVGEDMVMVVKRFADSGMSWEEISMRMDVPYEYIEECLEAGDDDE